MTREGMSWDVEGMSIVIKDHGVEVMRCFIGEAMEAAGRDLIELHLHCIERSPWIPGWHPEEVVQKHLDSLLLRDEE
jgi:hypothetical protein